jgi:hypothetical protein
MRERALARTQQDLLAHATMPARIPPDNAHLLINPAAYSTDNSKGYDKTTTYNLIMDTCRCLDEDLRRIQGSSVDDGSKFITGFSFEFL